MKYILLFIIIMNKMSNSAGFAENKFKPLLESVSEERILAKLLPTAEDALLFAGQFPLRNAQQIIRVIQNAGDLYGQSVLCTYFLLFAHALMPSSIHA